MKREKEFAAPPPGDDPLEFVMSDGSVDRMGDVIEPDGWRLDNFRRNPMALFAHDPEFIVGNWRDVGVRKGQLTGRLELMDPVSDRLREIKTAIEGGFLRAVSVGFHSDSAEPLGKGGGLRFTEAELVECSLVSVPANPNALRKAALLGISREGQRLIFGVSADGDRPPSSRSTGVPAATQTIHRKQSPMYSERIQAAQQEVVGLQDQLAALPDVEDVAKVSDLTAKIGEVKNKIFAWVEAEKALGDTAAPITIPKERVQVFRPNEALPFFRPNEALPSTTSKVWAQPKRKEVPPEDHLLRELAATAIGHIERMPIEMALTKLYGSYGDFEQTKGVFEWRQRAATAPATTTTATWAAELALTGQGAWFNALMAGSIFQPVSSRGMNVTLGRNNQISMPTRQATPTVAGSFVAEGAPIPVRQAAFTAITIGLKKMAVITSYTREIAEHSTPEIETILRQLIMDDTGVAVDTVFIDATSSTSVRPGGIRAGVAGQTPTAGGGFNALVGDIKLLVGILAAMNALSNPVWIMNPVQAISIGLTQNAGGDFPFQGEINAGRLLGYPVVVSSIVTAGMIILINADDLMVVQGDTPRFDVSDQATLHFEDTTPLQISTTGSPNTVAAPVRSMFQTDSLALRMILPMNWAIRRTPSPVAWVTGVTW
jgi:Phage capsid family/Caudovirus prohead serine protease